MGLIAFPLLIAVVGALLYALAANPKVQEIGRILFFVGALVVVWSAAPRMVDLLK